MNAVEKSNLVAIEVINRWQASVVKEAIALREEEGEGEFRCFLNGYTQHSIQELNESSRWN